MALQITSLMWLRTIMHLGIVSGIVLTEMGPVDLQLLRVIGKIWSNFLNVLLFFFCKAIFAAFLFGHAKLQNGSYISDN